MALTRIVIKNIITKLLAREDYRIEVITLINGDFLQYAIDFFKRIVDAKLKDKDLDLDWYKENFVENSLIDVKERAIYAGINKKTIYNMHGTATRQVVIDAATENYEHLSAAINTLIEEEKDLDLTLTIKFKKLSVDLTLNESLLVINALAVKRLELTGGYWAKAGKRVERPLMLTLCKLFQVPESYYSSLPNGSFYRYIEITRQIDFYINNGSGTYYKCEVKLMGKGNPESADAAFARDTKIFVADTLSKKNVAQLNGASIEYVELRRNEGFKRFAKVLMHKDIPFTDFEGKLDEVLPGIFTEIFGENI